MRAGTQTLIQALQALPWTEDQDHDEEVNHGLSLSDIDSDDEGKRGSFGATHIAVTSSH
jgi:sterol 3beta-glucosyltransferase